MPQAPRVAVGRAGGGLQSTATSPIANVVSGACPQVAPAALRGCGGAAARHHDPSQRAHQRPARAGVRVRRCARRRQDHDGPYPGAGAELRERPDGRSLRSMRGLRRDRPGPRSRRPRNRRRDAHRRRQRPRRDHQQPGDRAGPRPLQGVRDRRGPSALLVVVQCAPEVGGGAAAARRVHHGDDGAAQDSRHHPLALAGLRVPHDRDARHRRAAARHRGRGSDRSRRRCAGADCAVCGRQPARRGKRVRSGDLLLGDGRRRGRCGDGAGAGRPRSAVRHPVRGRRRRCCRRLHPGGPRGGIRDRFAHPVPRAGGARPRDDAGVDRRGPAGRSGSGVRVGSRAPEGADAALFARGSAAIVRSAGEGRAGCPRRLAAALCPRDGAGEVDSPASSGAYRRLDCRPRARRRSLDGSAASRIGRRALGGAAARAVHDVRVAAGVWRAPGDRIGARFPPGAEHDACGTARDR